MNTRILDKADELAKKQRAEQTERAKAQAELHARLVALQAQARKS